MWKWADTVDADVSGQEMNPNLMKASIFPSSFLEILQNNFLSSDIVYGLVDLPIDNFFHKSLLNP